MMTKNTLPDSRERKKCNHKNVVSLKDIMENKPVLNRLFRNGTIAPEKWNLADL